MTRRLTLSEQCEQFAEAAEPLRAELTRLRDQVCGWLLRHRWVIYLIAAYVTVVVGWGIAITVGLIGDGS